jgi:hypothetical protein
MTEAERFADRLGEERAVECKSLDSEFNDLQFFSLPADERQQH